MKIVRSFPRSVRAVENVWIPLPDGRRLAARMWLPDDAETHPVPALLEYIPYRKRDFTRGRDAMMHPYFAGHGYAVLRVDLRGTGESDGLLRDEYLASEHDDAEAVIAWAAAQPWCTGAVGMMGISWGGFNALQVAARRPPALRAILTLCAADDRYADDAHYMGGCLLNENLTWGSVFLLFNALPPDPALVGDRWRTMWRQRLDHAQLFPAVWMRHPHRDAYWQHGSVGEDYGRIQCPVYAVGGWADGYSNAVPRLLAGLTTPAKGLVGPWSHAFPHDSRPGPSIGFLQEALRWWDHWLKDHDTGIMDEPQYRVWMQDYVPPQPTYEVRPGRWVAEAAWPSPRIQTQTYHLAPGKLLEDAASEATLTLASPAITGQTGGDWCAFGSDGEMPTDQRPDDGRSLVFDTVPLTEKLEILGAPTVTLEVAVDRPVALLAVRLCDVAPGGASTRVTYGLLNLTHRDGHAAPQPLVPGERYRVQVSLNDIAHAFPPGHRLRLAVSTHYWPIAWPAPEPVTLSLFTGGATLALPVRPPDPADAYLPPFAAPEAAPPLDHALLRPARSRRTVERDLHTNETTYTIYSDGGDFEGAALARLEAIDLAVGHTILKRFVIHQHDPAAARAEVEQEAVLHREGWHIRVTARTRLTATPTAFRVEATLEAFEGDTRIFARDWDEEVPRQLV